MLHILRGLPRFPVLSILGRPDARLVLGVSIWIGGSSHAGSACEWIDSKIYLKNKDSRKFC